MEPPRTDCFGICRSACACLPPPGQDAGTSVGANDATHHVRPRSVALGSCRAHQFAFVVVRDRSPPCGNIAGTSGSANVPPTVALTSCRTHSRNACNAPDVPLPTKAAAVKLMDWSPIAPLNEASTPVVNGSRYPASSAPASRAICSGPRTQPPRASWRSGEPRQGR